MSGADFNTDGQSQAKIMYNAFERPDNNTWVYNFHVFYPWAGCSNQVIDSHIQAAA